MNRLEKDGRKALGHGGGESVDSGVVRELSSAELGEILLKKMA